MPIAGLVITLGNDARLAGDAIMHLRCEPTLTLGTQAGLRLPAVCEATDDDHARSIHSRIERMVGVSHVDVVFVSVEAGT